MDYYSHTAPQNVKMAGMLQHHELSAAVQAAIIAAQLAGALPALTRTFGFDAAM